MKLSIIIFHWIFLVAIVCVALVHAIDIDRMCPRMLDHIFDGRGPIGNGFLRYFK